MKTRIYRVNSFAQPLPVGVRAWAVVGEPVVLGDFSLTVFMDRDVDGIYQMVVVVLTKDNRRFESTRGLGALVVPQTYRLPPFLTRSIEYVDDRPARVLFDVFSEPAMCPKAG